MGKRSGQYPIWTKTIYQERKKYAGLSKKWVKVSTVLIYELQEEINEKGVKTEIMPLNRTATRISLKELEKEERRQNEDTINKRSKKGRKDTRGIIWSKWFGKNSTFTNLKGQHLNPKFRQGSTIS